VYIKYLLPTPPKMVHDPRLKSTAAKKFDAGSFSTVAKEKLAYYIMYKEVVQVLCQMHI